MRPDHSPLLLQCAPSAVPAPVTKVMFFDHATTAAAFAKPGSPSSTPFVEAPDMIVQASHRDGPGQVETRAL